MLRRFRCVHILVKQQFFVIYPSAPRHSMMECHDFDSKPLFTGTPLYSQLLSRTHKLRGNAELTSSTQSNRAACDKMNMTFLQVLRYFQGVDIALQLLLLLLLLPLPLLRSSPCPSNVEEMVVKTTTHANTLAEALLCEGSASFTVRWHGNVILSRTLSVSNGSTLNVTASSESTDADTGAVVTSDGTLLLFEADLGSTVSLTGLTLHGGDGALTVTGGSLVEVIDCTFTRNNRTSSYQGGGLTRLFSLYLPQRTLDRLQ